MCKTVMAVQTHRSLGHRLAWEFAARAWDMRSRVGMLAVPAYLRVHITQLSAATTGHSRLLGQMAEAEA
jgi:hypothetical protein